MGVRMAVEQVGIHVGMVTRMYPLFYRSDVRMQTEKAKGVPREALGQPFAVRC
jgi:hypothetical protein